MFLWLVITFVIVSYLYATRKFSYWKERGIPFEKPIPYIGNSSLVLFKHCLGTYLRELYQKFDTSLIGFFLFDQPQLVIKDPQIIKSIVIENFQNFEDRTITSNIRDDPIGTQVLFALKNPYWRAIRQKISVVFTSGKIKLMLPLMIETGKDLLNYMEKKSGAPIDAKELCVRYLTDVTASCAFGVKGYSFESERSDFLEFSLNFIKFTWKRSIEMTCYFISPFLVKLFRLKFMDPYYCNLLKNIFWKVAEDRRKTSVKRNDLVDILMEIRENESINEQFKFDGDILIAQAVQFFAAGYETSSTAGCFALYELTKFSDVQNKLREEILEEIGKSNSLTYEGIQSMKYLEMVIYETVRKYPVLPFLDRRTKSDYLIPGSNKVIEKGMAVFVPVLGLHYDPNYYPEPEKFDPERFNQENRLSRPSCVFLGFGEGPRNCVGSRFALITLKILLINILTEYEVLPCDETKPNITIDPRGFLLTSAHPVKLQFRKIKTL